MAMRKKKSILDTLKVDTSKGVETLEPKKAKKAAPKRTRKAAAKKETFDHNCYVVIDYPQQSETISGLHYAIRMGASENGAVELSFDNGDWQPARQAAGFWWFDWGYFTPGEHTLVARLRDAAGKTLKQTALITVKVI